MTPTDYKLHFVLQSVEDDLRAKLLNNSESATQDETLEKSLSNAKKVMIMCVVIVNSYHVASYNLFDFNK